MIMCPCRLNVSLFTTVCSPVKYLGQLRGMTYLVVRLQSVLHWPSNIRALSNSPIVHCRVYRSYHSLQFSEHTLEFRMSDWIVAGWRLSAEITEKQWVFADSLNGLHWSDFGCVVRQMLTFTTRSRKERALFRSASRLAAQMVSDDRASIPFSASSYEAIRRAASPRKALWAAYSSYARNRCV
jgi:hypothetical protein